MGTKNNPGEFDCYEAAEPDEPMFVLLGRDRHAALLTRVWALLRHDEGEDAAKVAEALSCADAMDRWCKAQGKQPIQADELMMMVTGGMDQHPDDYSGACACHECTALSLPG